RGNCRQDPPARCGPRRVAFRDDLARRVGGDRSRPQGVRRRAASRGDHRRRGVRTRGPQDPQGKGEAMIAILCILQTLRIAVPYMFAAAGGVISERAGMIALSLEGYMLTGAFCAALGAYYSGSAWAGVLAGAGGAMVMALIYAIAAVRFRADQVVIGIAINLMAI